MEATPDTGRTDQLSVSGFGSAMDDAQVEREEVGFLDRIQTLGHVDNVLSRPSTASTAGTPNELVSDASHKRKREQDTDLPCAMHEALSMTSQVEGVHFSDSPGNSKPVDQLMSTTQHCTPVNLYSKVQRSNTSGSNLVCEIGSKKLSQSSALPAVFWQHILCFVPPVFLGRLLRVNRAFNAYLTPGKLNEISNAVPLSQSVMQPMKAEAIWVASRKRFCPGLPKPLDGVYELDMWRLLRGRDCQICGEGKETTSFPIADNPWKFGSGNASVRVVWPFGVRSCSSCLLKISQSVCIALCGL